MKKLEFTQFQKILISIIIGLVLVLIVGTIAGLINKSQKESPSYAEKLLFQGKAVNLVEPVDDSVISYFEIGRIRIVTKNENSDDLGTILVIAPYLAYPSGDTVFYEELFRKKGLIKGLLQDYFQSRTKNEILAETEERIEKILLNEINAQFSLGQISDIYFTDYIFLE